MNVSPETNIEGTNTEITAMAISPITNKLDKNQKSGDATKVKTSGELEIVREDVPVIDSKSVYYEFNLEGKRKLSTGEVMMKTTGVTKERRKLQKAIMKEQEKQRGLVQDEGEYTKE